MPGILSGINATNVMTNEKMIIFIRFAEDERGNWTRRTLAINSKQPFLEQNRTITYHED